MELYLLEVDLDPVHIVIVNEVRHVAEGLGLVQSVRHVADGSLAAGHSPPTRLDLKLINVSKLCWILRKENGASYEFKNEVCLP